MSDETALVKGDAITLQRRAAQDRFAVEMGQAKVIYESGMFPDLKSPQQAYVKGLFAREHEIPVLTAMRQLYFVQGKVALEADLMKGMVVRTGTARFEYEMGEGFCNLLATRTDSGDSYPAKWNRERAARAGLDRKDNWKKYEAEMLRHACDREACRALWPDVVGGMYTTDELDSIPLAVVDEPESRTEAIKAALGVPPEDTPPDGAVAHPPGDTGDEGAGTEGHKEPQAVVQSPAPFSPDWSKADLSGRIIEIQDAHTALYDEVVAALGVEGIGLASFRKDELRELYEALTDAIDAEGA